MCTPSIPSAVAENKTKQNKTKQNKTGKLLGGLVTFLAELGRRKRKKKKEGKEEVEDKLNTGR